MVKAKLLAAAGALALLVQPQLAAAQQNCLSQPEISAMAVYAVPPVLAAVQSKCSAQLPDDGFLATEGRALAVRYAAIAPQKWPVARQALMKLATGASAQRGDERQIIATLAQLPDQSVRPVVDSLITQKLAETINIANCGQIEQGISLLAPLDPSQAGAITAFVLSLVRPDELPLCEAPKP